MKLEMVTHVRGDDDERARIASAPRERWLHPFSSITEDPLREPPALVQRILAGTSERDPLLVARIEAVHRVLGRCNVPHVLPLRGVERAPDGSLSLVYREVLGEDLGTMLARGPVSLERAFAILRQLCRAIGRAHAVGVEHRLLGPASVVVTGRGTGPGLIEIIDFGLAALVDDDIVREGAATLAPISPERVLGGGTGVSEDVYAIGALAFFMTTGRPVFLGDDPSKLRRRHAIEDCPSLADVAAYDVPDTLVDAVDRALHKDPDDRPVDVAELEAAIVRAQREARIETAYDALLDGPPQRTRRDRGEAGGSPRPRRRRTLPMSIDPAMVDGRSGTSGAAACGTSGPVASAPRRGGTLVAPAPARRRSWWPHAIAVAVATSVLGGWLALTGAPPDIARAERPPEPDAPSVYAGGLSDAPHRSAPEQPRTVTDPLPDAPGPSVALDAATSEPVVTELEDHDAELASIVIEPEPEPAIVGEAPRSPARPSDAACSTERRTAYAARNEHRWRALLSATGRADCWASHREPAKLRIKALMELQRFDECAKIGATLARPDPELARWVALCRERAKPAGEPGEARDRYAAASAQQ